MENLGIDYNRYEFTRDEWFKYILMGSGYYFVMGMIFYQHVFMACVAMVGVIIFLKEKRRMAVKRRKEELLIQFREAMYALSSSLSAGRSAEQAFVQSLKDIRIIYGEEEDIVVEWQRIVDKLRVNETIESALEDFDKRTDVEDIHNFVSVFIMAKRSGGDLLRIIRDTNSIINEKIEIRQEIDVLITQKKFEQQILSYIIPGMILFFNATSPNFLAPLYATMAGRMVMTAALVLYMVSAAIGKKIVAIEV